MKNKLLKKIAVSKKVNITDRYQGLISIWVMDNPQSRNKPKPTVTMKHGSGSRKGQNLRMSFDDTDDIVSFFKDCIEFIESKKDQVDQAAAEAREEWERRNSTGEVFRQDKTKEAEDKTDQLLKELSS